jgi:hypothetical protein
MQKMGSWKLGSFSKDRSPDPVDVCIVSFHFARCLDCLFGQEHNQFCANILNKLESAAFANPICVVMLNQDYFNGEYFQSFYNSPLY